MKVLKFGGSSVAIPASINLVSEIVKHGVVHNLSSYCQRQYYLAGNFAISGTADDDSLTRCGSNCRYGCYQVGAI